MLQQNNDKKTPDIGKVAKFYTDLYKKEMNDTPTPILNQWLSKLKKYANLQHKDQQIDQNCIKKKVTNALMKTSPWKATGEDKIPTYLYKIFPAAQKFLISFITEKFQDKTKLTQADTRANVILLYKKGDEKDPANYRPIARFEFGFPLYEPILVVVL